MLQSLRFTLTVLVDRPSGTDHTACMTELRLQVGYGAYLNLLAFQKYHMRDLDYGMPVI